MSAPTPAELAVTHAREAAAAWHAAQAASKRAAATSARVLEDDREYLTASATWHEDMNRGLNRAMGAKP